MVRIYLARWIGYLVRYLRRPAFRPGDYRW